MFINRANNCDHTLMDEDVKEEVTMKRTAQLAKCIVAIFIVSGILNVFYILGILPQQASKIGFVMVVLGVILVNIKGMNKKDKYKAYKNSLYSWVGIGSVIFWFLTYVLTILGE